MINILKLSALAIYLLAAFGALLALPENIITPIRYLAVILLLAHVLEMAIALRYIKRHPGPLLDSLALTLLFGFLHWRPLKQS